MRAGGAVLCGLLSVVGVACAPGFDQFAVARRDAGPRLDAGPGADGGNDGTDAGNDGVDAGPAVDAGRRDGGPVGPGGTALGGGRACADALRTVLMEESFDTGAEFWRRYGTVTVEGGSAVFPGGQDYVLYESTSSFRDVVACATVRVGRTTGAELNELHVALRGPMHGLSLNLAGNAGEVKLVSVETERNVLLDRQTLDWASGATLTALVFLEGTRAYGEVRDDATGAVVALSGTYGGEQADVTATFEGSELVVPAYVDHIHVGRPADAVAPILRGP